MGGDGGQIGETGYCKKAVRRPRIHHGSAGLLPRIVPSGFIIDAQTVAANRHNNQQCKELLVVGSRNLFLFSTSLADQRLNSLVDAIGYAGRVSSFQYRVSNAATRPHSR